MPPQQRSNPSDLDSARVTYIGWQSQAQRRCQGTCLKFWTWAFAQIEYAYYLGSIWYTFAIYWYFWLQYDDCDYQLLAQHILIAGSINLMAFWSYYTAKTSDPGKIQWHHFREQKLLADTKNKEKWLKVQKEWLGLEDKKDFKPPVAVPGEERNPNECHKCGCIRSLGVHHCSSCGRCVYKMDHHCVWTNNCVGWLTIKPFMLFNFYVALLMVYQIKMLNGVSQSRGLDYVQPQFMLLLRQFGYGGTKVCNDNCQSDRFGTLDLDCLQDCLNIEYQTVMSESFEKLAQMSTFYSLALLLAYNLYIMIFTGIFIWSQTSLINFMKNGIIISPKAKRLSFSQWMQYVFGQPSLSWHCFIPSINYKDMEVASQEFVKVVDDWDAYQQHLKDRANTNQKQKKE